MSSTDPQRADDSVPEDASRPELHWGDPAPAPRVSADRVRREHSRTAERSRGSISTGRWMWEGVKAAATALLLFFCIRVFLVEAYKIPTGSMENTLMVGDFLLVNKAVYGAAVPFSDAHLPAFTTPERRDVIVFIPPQDPTKNYVKRIVGVPGDTLEMHDKLLYVDGEAQREPYTRHIDPFTDPYDPAMEWQARYLAGDSVAPALYHPTRDNWGPIVVPPHKYFALGDNRDNSEDSRYWGFLDRSSIRGRPMFVYYSFQPDPLHPFSWLTDIRWGRIGEAIR
ncbi:MAG TPA: signal peptidase I [Longimicrobiaceae bacterium]|nr:signal peptidase I [Longimicrobiaceae bacterium]